MAKKNERQAKDAKVGRQRSANFLRHIAGGYLYDRASGRGFFVSRQTADRITGFLMNRSQQASPASPSG
jgi:hypothetical protein